MVSLGFFFEDANGKLLKYFHGSRGVTAQIFRSFIGASHLHTLTQSYIVNTSANEVLDRIVSTASFCKNAQRFGSDVVCLGTGVKRPICSKELAAVSEFLHLALSSTDITEYQRVVISGMLQHTLIYSESTCRQDCYFKSNKCQAFVLLTCMIVDNDSASHHNVTPETVTKVVLLAHPVHESPVHNFDGDVCANLSEFIKKAVVDYSTVVASIPSECARKLFVLCDVSQNLFTIPVPIFELD